MRWTPRNRSGRSNRAATVSGRDVSRPTREPRLLVGFDGSTTACRALAWALGRARNQPARLVFVYVSAPPRWAFAPQVLCEWHVAEAALSAAIERQLEAVLGDSGVPWEFQHRSGRPVIELAQVADALRVDAVVVGMSRCWIRLLGLSMAGRLLRSAHWPVIMVP